MTRARSVSYRRWASLFAASCLLLALLGSFAVTLVRHDREAKHDLTARYESRADLSAQFVRNYLMDFAARVKRRAATRALSAPTVDTTTFSETAVAMEFDAAALVDEHGTLLQVWPPKPAILGTNVAEKYDHLKIAVNGYIGISNVVLSAAESVPIVAVAVPYQSDVGLRVVSGAFSAHATPLGSYFSHVSPIRGSRAFLLDYNGAPIDSGRARRARPGTLEATAVAHLTARTGEIRHAGVTYTYAVSEVPRTPWRVVLAAPSAAVYQPLNRQPWGEWALLGAFAVAGVVALVLLGRLGRARAVASALARIDPLTGLPNRRAVDEAFVRMAAHANRNGYQLAVLSIDLDHFKAINDTLGHKTGDQALMATGDALRSTVRAEDIVGRWGGEEFLVILADASRDGAIRAATRMRSAITERATTAGIPGRLTASVGAAIDHPLDLESLLRTADRALYVAKERGRDRIHLAEDPLMTPPELRPGAPTAV